MACALGELAGSPQKAPIPGQPGDLTLELAPSGPAAYRAQMTLRFTGQDRQATLTLSDEWDSSAGARHLLAKTELSNEPPASFELYRLGDQAFLVSTEVGSQAGCMRLDNPQASAQMPLRMVDIFTSIRRGDLVQSGETVNGITADHYALAEAALGLGTATGWSGDVWVAQPGGYVVRFSGSAEAETALTGQAGSGRLEWDYQVFTQGLAPAALPEDCAGIASGGLPIPEGAQNVMQVGALVSFDSPQGAAEMVEYYRQVLPTAGWAIDEESGTDSLFTLGASMGERAVQVAITAREQGCGVTINEK